jgi:hypothetical protein
VDRQAELLEIVRTLHTTRRFSRRLNGGKKKTYQNADDRNDDQEFDERETALSSEVAFHFVFLKDLKK